MELKFKPTGEASVISNLEVDGDKCFVRCHIEERNNQVAIECCVSIEEDRGDEKDLPEEEKPEPGHIAIWLRKNEARHLANFLLAFANDKTK